MENSKNRCTRQEYNPGHQVAIACKEGRRPNRTIGALGPFLPISPIKATKGLLKKKEVEEQIYSPCCKDGLTNMCHPTSNRSQLATCIVK